MAKTRRQYKDKEENIYVMKGCSKGRPKASSRHKASRRQNKKASKRPKCVTRQKTLMRKQSLQRGIRQSIGLTGGNCTTCLNGGSTANALIGAPWSATNSETQPSSNHYAQNMYDKADPQLMMQVRGGKRRGVKGSRGQVRKSKRRGLNGGALMDLVPSDLVNLGRDVTYNVGSAYSSLTGATQPVNPNVTEQQLNTSVNLHKILV